MFFFFFFEMRLGMWFWSGNESPWARRSDMSPQSACCLNPEGTWLEVPGLAPLLQALPVGPSTYLNTGIRPFQSYQATLGFQLVQFQTFL